MAEIDSTGQTNRFRRVGEYDWDTLLKDLRDLDDEVRQIITGVNDTDFIGPPGPQGPRGTQGSPGPKGDEGEPGIQGEPGAFDQAVVMESWQNDGYIGNYFYFIQLLNWALEQMLSVNEENPDEVPIDDLVEVQRYDFGFIGVDAGLVTESPVGVADLGTLF